MYWFSEFPVAVDLTVYESLNFFLKVSNPGGSVPIIVKSGTGAGQQSVVLSENYIVGGGSLDGTFQFIKIPISEFQNGDADLTQVLAIQFSDDTNEGGSWHATGWNTEIWIDDLVLDVLRDPAAVVLDPDLDPIAQRLGGGVELRLKPAPRFFKAPFVGRLNAVAN